jgi:hypothetical protein
MPTYCALTVRPSGATCYTTSVKILAFAIVVGLWHVHQPHCHLQPLELQERYRRCRVLKEARRWHALWLLSQGQRAAQVAEILGMSPAWVRHVRQCYNARGPEAVPEGHQRNPGGALAAQGIVILMAHVLK